MTVEVLSRSAVVVGATAADRKKAIALVGCLLVGLVLVRTDDLPIGAAILLATSAMLFGLPVAWLVFGLAWTVIGVLLFARPEPLAPTSRFA